MRRFLKHDRFPSYVKSVHNRLQRYDSGLSLEWENGMWGVWHRSRTGVPYLVVGLIGGRGEVLVPGKTVGYMWILDKIQRQDGANKRSKDLVKQVEDNHNERMQKNEDYYLDKMIEETKAHSRYLRGMPQISVPDNLEKKNDAQGVAQSPQGTD